MSRFITVHPGSPRLSTVPPRLRHGSSRFVPDHQTGMNRHLKPGQWERGLKHMLYLDQIVHTFFGSNFAYFFIFFYFDIVQTFVCKTVTRLCQASFWPVEILSENVHKHWAPRLARRGQMLITLEPHGIFWSNLAYLYILILSRHWYAK